MKRILLLALAVLPILVSCEKNTIEEEEKVTIKLDVTNLTDDGYFDGLLYYKITSNSPCEVSINKAEKTATMVEIPSRIEINGNIYSCTSIADNAFFQCGTLSSITIPKTVRSIGVCSFEGCGDLKNVNMSEGIKSIGFSAFRGCSELKTITIPKGITVIEPSTFSGCNGLTSITIPEGVTIIHDGAFSYCSHLTTITFPESLNIISAGAFHECRKLTSVVCKGTTPPTCPYEVFTAYNDDYQDYRPYCQSVTLYVPKGSKEAYQNSEPWNTFKEIIEQ